MYVFRLTLVSPPISYYSFMSWGPAVFIRISWVRNDIFLVKIEKKTNPGNERKVDPDPKILKHRSYALSK